jgi:hypothetical protein
MHTQTHGVLRDWEVSNKRKKEKPSILEQTYNLSIWEVR